MTHLGLELEELSNPAEKLRPFLIASVSRRDSIRTPTPARLHCEHRHRRADSGGLRSAECPHRNEGRLRAARNAYPGHRHRSEGWNIRGEASNGVLLSERESGSPTRMRVSSICRRCAGRRRLRGLGWPRRSGDRPRRHPEPSGCARHLRHCPRSCGKRNRPPEADLYGLSSAYCCPGCRHRCRSQEPRRDPFERSSALAVHADRRLRVPVRHEMLPHRTEHAALAKKPWMSTTTSSCGSAWNGTTGVMSRAMSTTCRSVRDRLRHARAERRRRVAERAARGLVERRNGSSGHGHHR